MPWEAPRAGASRRRLASCGAPTHYRRPGVGNRESSLTARSPAERRDPGWFARPAELGLDGWYALVVLILASRPFYDLILRSPQWPIITGGAWLVVLVLALLAILPVARLRWITWSMRALPFLWIVLVVAFASAMWSLQPARTLNQAFWLTVISVVGVAIGCLVSPRLLMRALFWALTTLLLASLAAELLAADLWLGRATDGDRWHGVMWHPNFLGSVAACAGVYFLVALLHRRLDWRPAAFLLSIAAIITVMSASATSIVMLVTGGAIVISFRVGSRVRFGGDLTTLLVVLGLIGSATIGLTYWEATTNLLGKDVTATNRTAIWQDAIEIVGYRPLSGFGYGAVWGLHDRTFFPEFDMTAWASHAHNGFLQVATQLGLPAAGATVALLIHTLIRGINAFSRFSSAFALFSLGYVVMFVVGNMTEARLFERALLDWDWLLFVILATALAAAESGSPYSKSGCSLRPIGVRRRGMRRHSATPLSTVSEGRARRSTVRRRAEGDRG
jgi:exopolysaccharide production protein ExoQ